MSEIFNNPGIVFTSQLAVSASLNAYACIGIKIGDSDTVFQQAPVIGIRIDLQVDFSLAKTMAGNFNLVTFLDLPVTITIKGMRSLYKSCEDTASKAQTIGLMYKKIKASGTSLLVQITIGTLIYKATIVALTEMSSLEAPGILTYNLTLFGVRSA